MLKNRGSQKFLYSSIQLYGLPDLKLITTADELLKTLSKKEPRPSGPDVKNAGYVLRKAEREIRLYQKMRLINRFINNLAIAQ